VEITVNLGYTKFVRRHITALLLLASFGVASATAQSRPTLHIAAAADLQPVMPVFAQAYEKATGVKLEVSFGSSSALATQIINGAPMDVFLGADFSFPEKVVAANLADESAPVPYANGTLVLWTRKDSGISPISTDRLTDPKVTRIAVADQFHAPFGRAAYAALNSLKLMDQVKDKLVVAENVSQAAQFAESGNAQVAFISLTLASTEHMKQIGTYNRVPKVYPQIQQCAVVIKTSKNLAEAHKFLDWLTSEQVQNNLSQFGLEAVK
jgi:molybdate transport system substrate-binding protein